MNEEKVLTALRGVRDPELGRDIVDLGMVREVSVSGDAIAVEIALTIAGCPFRQSIKRQVEEVLRETAPQRRAEVALSVMTPGERESLLQQLGLTRESKNRIAEPDTATRIIAVGSGKGGVGKSTVAANLARAFARAGRRVGLMDADIHGFSLPLLLDVGGRPRVVDGGIEPWRTRGIQVMSMGFFTEDDAPVLWRGPMLMKAVQQFIRDVRWDDDLEFLVVDLPPGTGDVPLTVAAKLPRASMLIVTSPERSSVSVASRAARMAKRTKMQILGVVENMSHLRCPDCRELMHPFGRGGGEELAGRLGVPLLAQIPLDVPSGQHRELAVDRDRSEAGEAIRSLAENLILSQERRDERGG